LGFIYPSPLHTVTVIPLFVVNLSLFGGSVRVEIQKILRKS